MIRPLPRWLSLTLAFCLLVAMYLLMTGDEGRRSHTADEANHLVRGIALWQTGTTALSYSHPPLANGLATLPLGSRIHRVDLTELSPWEHRDPNRIGTAYFERDFEQARMDLSVARHASAALAISFAATLFGWCWKRWGSTTALVALALTAGHPTLLAHGGLMTTDMPVTFAASVTLIQFVRWLEAKGVVRLLLFGLSAGLLLSTKHSGVVMLGLMGALAVVWAWRGLGRFAGTSGRHRPVTAGGELLITGVIALLVVDAAYSFQDTGLTVDEIVEHPEPHNWISRNYEQDIIHESPLLSGSTPIPIPIPYPYIYGLVSLGHQSRIGHLSYLAGIRARRNPLYFPSLILIKTPVGILGLLVLGWWLVRRKHVAMSSRTVTLLSFGALFVGVASVGTINIGVRHVLPVFPILIVVAARVAVIGWSVLASSRWGRPAIAAAVASASLAGGLAYPHFISHFNALVGGAWGGHRISVVGEDWGQDNTVLAYWLVDNGITRVEYYDSGRPLRHEELRRHGLETTKLRCHDVPSADSVAVTHVTDQVRHPECLQWTDVCRKLKVINHHLYVWSCPANAALEALR